MSSKLSPSPFDLLLWSKDSLTVMKAEQVWKFLQWEAMCNSPFPYLAMPSTGTIPDPVTISPVPSPLPERQDFPE